jgi:hypothetical protein
MKALRWLILIIPLGFWGCCKEKKEPCKGQQSTSADFTIEEYLYTSADYPKTNVILETDTINGLNTVRFRAKQEFDEYTWLIGTEVIKDRSFTRKFFPEKSNIKVTLIGKRKPNKQCFPDDDGIDTVTKFMYVIPKDLKLEQRHTYHGYNTDNPSDTFTIQLAYWHVQYKEWMLRMNNFPKGWTNDGYFYIGGSKWLYINFRNHARNPGLVALIEFSSDYNNVTIQYNLNKALLDYQEGKRTDFEPPILISKTFKGTRI